MGGIHPNHIRSWLNSPEKHEEPEKFGSSWIRVGDISHKLSSQGNQMAFNFSLRVGTLKPDQPSAGKNLTHPYARRAFFSRFFFHPGQQHLLLIKVYDSWGYQSCPDPVAWLLKAVISTVQKINAVALKTGPKILDVSL